MRDGSDTRKDADQPGKRTQALASMSGVLGPGPPAGPWALSPDPVQRRGL